MFANVHRSAGRCQLMHRRRLYLSLAFVAVWLPASALCAESASSDTRRMSSRRSSGRVHRSASSAKAGKQRTSGTPGLSEDVALERVADLLLAQHWIRALAGGAESDAAFQQRTGQTKAAALMQHTQVAAALRAAIAGAPGRHVKALLRGVLDSAARRDVAAALQKLARAGTNRAGEAGSGNAVTEEQRRAISPLTDLATAMGWTTGTLLGYIE